METIDLFKKKIISLEGKDYGAYQDILGEYIFSNFKLIIQQIPKDPYAPSHTGIYRILVSRSDKNIVTLEINSKIQKIANEDFLARNFYKACIQNSKGIRGTGFSGLITINEPSQIIIERNCVIVTEETIEIRCFLGLPANGRTIDSTTAKTMIFDELPEIVNQALLKNNIDQTQLKKHVNTVEDAEYLRSQLDSLDLVAFISNGSILPRTSGTSDQPMERSKAIEFSSPNSLSKTINLPHAGKIQGMAIPKGVTLITGGGYHGKSTLLNALESGIYNHIPEDGRERCVSNPQSVKVRAYSGRNVVKTDISPFIKNLPYRKDTTAFCTENASGSTSQASNIIEAIEAGAKVLLMDEDTCATNFMIRDLKMQLLVNKDDEPITTFIDKVKQLYEENGISTILVLGGVGDYFDVSDHVIQMLNYIPIDVTEKVKEIVSGFSQKRFSENSASTIKVRERIPIPESISPLNEHGKFSIYTKETNRLYYGKDTLDLTDLEQLIELSQTKALGYSMEYCKKYMNGKRTLREVTERVIKDIEKMGLDTISERISGHFAGFRSLELCFAINRLRSLSVLQKPE